MASRATAQDQSPRRWANDRVAFGIETHLPDVAWISKGTVSLSDQDRGEVNRLAGSVGNAIRRVNSATGSTAVTL